MFALAILFNCTNICTDTFVFAEIAFSVSPRLTVYTFAARAAGLATVGVGLDADGAAGAFVAPTFKTCPIEIKLTFLIPFQLAN